MQLSYCIRKPNKVGMNQVCLKILSSFCSKVSFGEFAPYLITNEASLDALNEELPMPVSMTRFRPNIVVRGLKAWEEVFYFLSSTFYLVVLVAGLPNNLGPPRKFLGLMRGALPFLGPFQQIRRECSYD